MAAALKLVAERAGAGVAAAPLAAARSLLRFITCGSVDDGKSTLLGRLLFETGSVFEDQAEALARDSRRFGTTGEAPDYALLVDGLAAEREQGITIDVAYRYFATPRRAFIAADTPGHEQYTRNMATGASTADAAIILVDARKGLLPQTRRHSYIVSMLGVRRVIVAVNKMDLVGYDEDAFRAVERAYQALARSLGFAETHVLPLSAVGGDNVAGPSARTPWYRGPALLHLLETIDASPRGDLAFRLPVQWVNRPSHDFRGFAGTLAGGSVRVGEDIRVLPRGQTARIARILGPSGDLDEAVAGQSVTLTLSDEIDISRGDVIVHAASPQSAAARLDARILALSEAGLAPGRPYLAKIGAALAPARIVALHHAVDVHDYAETPAAALPLNGIGAATLRFDAPVAAAAYAACRELGGLILIDPASFDTVGLGVVETVETGAAARRPIRAAALPALLGRFFPSLAEADRVVLAQRAGRGVPGALLVAGLVLAASGAPGWAALAFGADLALRPLLGRVYDRVGDALLARRADAGRFGLDGGGI